MQNNYNKNLNILGKEYPEENWKKITGYETYEVSSRGKVRFIPNNKLLKQYTYKETGYYYVNLFKNHIPKKHMVHILMAKEFMGYKEEEKNIKHIVFHKDFRVRNNMIDNLEIITRAESLDRHLKNCKGDSLHPGIHPVSTGFNRLLYRVEVTINNLVVYLGTYNTKDEAIKIQNLGVNYSHLYVSPTQYRKLIYKIHKGIN